MSLARRHRDKILASLTVANGLHHGAATALPAALSPAVGKADPSPLSTPSHTPADRAAQQMALRLTHDLRDLKLIKSVDLKIAHKKKRIGEYGAWLEGLLSADAGLGTGLAAEVAPTIMVWSIDIGDYPQALKLGEFLIRHGAEMPARYNRDPASVLAEEIATAAIKAQAAGQTFPLDILQSVQELVADVDMHDEIRAKLSKALGSEYLRMGEDLPADEASETLTTAQRHLAEAQRLHDRIGVKDRLKRITKLLSATSAEPPTL